LATRAVNPNGANGLLYGGGTRQLVLQATVVGVVVLYSFIVTYVIGTVLGWLSGHKSRVAAKSETTGLDLTLHGETAYEMSQHGAE
jgi:Amt family ammonium transporter